MDGQNFMKLDEMFPESSKQLLLLFRTIRYPRWDIFNFFFNMAGQQLMKLGRNVPCDVLTKYCYFRGNATSNMAAISSDWLSHFCLLKFGWSEFHETWQKCSLQGLEYEAC